jgi:murein L,D-transpeptidase YafK
MRSIRPSLFRLIRRLGAAAVVASGAGLLAACDEASTGGANLAGSERASHPLSPEMVALMQQKGVSQNAPVLIRTFKKEAEFEVWKMKPDGRYALLRTYPMCRWSGQLGPKVREGDRQVPEGFYKITPGQMNPNSNYYLSFNVGYPNAYDRAWGHEGGSIMVHGACSSAGCFSMTDRQIAEIYAVAREGFAGGQHAIQMQSYPFHMTAENMAKYRSDPNIAFWKQLKEGSDNFEVTQQDVQVGVCARHYVFNAVPSDGGHFEATEPCPAMKHDSGIQADVAEKEHKDDLKVAELVAAGQPAIRTIYADGGQNPQFAKAALEDVSRPDAIAAGPTDWLVEPKGKKTSPVVKVAAAKAAAHAETAEKSAAGDKASATGEKAPTLVALAPAAGAKAAFGKTTLAKSSLDKTKLAKTEAGRAQAGKTAPAQKPEPAPHASPVSPQAAASPAVDETQAPRVVAGGEAIPGQVWSTLVHAVNQ